MATIARRERSTGEMPFLDHLEELRWRLIKSVGAVAVGCLVGLFVVTQLHLIDVLQAPITPYVPDEQLVFLSPTTPIVVTLKLALAVGIVLAIPFIGYQAWAFLSPALYENERRYIMPAVLIGTALFLAGTALAYFVVLPLGLEILLSWYRGTLQPFIAIDYYLRFAASLILAFGLMFEMPLVLVMLTLIGIVTPDTLARYRRHAIVVLAALSAILTPADPYTMLAMLVPMVGLYELSVFVARSLARPDREGHALERSRS